MNASSQNSSQPVRDIRRGLGAVLAAASFALMVAACEPKAAKPVPGAKSTVPVVVQGELIQPAATEKGRDGQGAAPPPAPIAPAEAPRPPQLIAGPAALSPETSFLRPGAPPGSEPNGKTLPSNSPVAMVRATVPSVATNAQASSTVKVDSDFSMVGFDKLSAFNFEVSDDILQSGTTNAVEVATKTSEQIPQSVRDYNNKRISLKGFMLPLKVEGGKVTEMLIMRDQSMCCYGSVPKINEWVSVRMVGGGVKPIMDQAVTLYGRLHVGEMRENGYLVGIYKMDGERLDGPADN